MLTGIHIDSLFDVIVFETADGGMCIMEQFKGNDGQSSNGPCSLGEFSDVPL